MPKRNNNTSSAVTPGTRLKTLRKEKHLTQAALEASIPGCICAKQIGYVENGIRPLHRDMAFKFSEFFGVDVSWLMCESDFRNQSEKYRSVISTAETEGNLLYTGFWAFAELNGYTVTAPNIEQEDAEKIVDAIKSGYIIEKGESAVSLSLEEMNHFENLLCDLTEQAFKYLFKERGIDIG